MAKADGFGGPQRSVHLQDCPLEWVGQIFRVFEVKSVATGIRYEGHYHRPGYDEMYGEYEPPYLAIDKRVRLAHLNVPQFNNMHDWGKITDGCWFPVAHLEKIHAISEAA
jgi:hypothetical protein